MFRAIMDSFPRQIREAIYGQTDEGEDGNEGDDDTMANETNREPINVQAQIKQLVALGEERNQPFS